MEIKSLQCDDLPMPLTRDNIDGVSRLSSTSTQCDEDTLDSVSISSVSSAGSAVCSYFKTYSSTSSNDSFSVTNIQNTPEWKPHTGITVLGEEELLNASVHNLQVQIHPQEEVDYISEQFPTELKTIADFFQCENDTDIYVYANRYLGNKLEGCDARRPTGLMFDLCIFTESKAPLVLTFVDESHKSNVEYNAILKRVFISAVRKNTITNFSLVGGVIDQEMCLSEKSLRQAIIKMEQEAHAFCIPRSLEMSKAKFQILKQRFTAMVCGNSTVSTPGENMKQSMTPKEDNKTDCVHVLLIGKSGAGKSSIGNTLLGRPEFKTGFYHRETNVPRHISHVTNDCTTYNVFDTSSRSDGQIQTEDINTYMRMWSSGSSVILFVVSVMQVATDVKDVFERFKALIGDQMLKYTIVVLTGKDSLDADITTFDKFMSDSGNSNIKRLIDDCGGRYVVVSNRENLEENRSQIFKAIDDVIRNYTGVSVDDNLHSRKPVCITDQKDRKHMSECSDRGSFKRVNGHTVSGSEGQNKAGRGARLLDRFKNFTNGAKRWVLTDM